MGTRLVDSYFFLKPEEEEDAPDSYIPFSRSRAIDIISTNLSGSLQLSSRSFYMTTAKEIKSFVDQILVQKDTTEPLQHVDRVYYENNWSFARNYLCRKFVKGVFDNGPSVEIKLQEDPALRNFQMFLNAADRRDDLDFSYFGLGSTLEGMLVGTNDRLLYHFGFDWVAAIQSKSPQDDEVFKSLHINTKKFQGNKYIVRRRTCIASVLRTQDTEELLGSPLCPASWESKFLLKHRRTIVMFNELHSNEDGLSFKDWISPERTDLWEVKADWNLYRDNEVTAVSFMHRLAGQIWNGVEMLALKEDLSIKQLEGLAQDTWEDSLAWFTIQKLLIAHRKTILKTQQDLKSLADLVGLKNEQDMLQNALDELKELEKIVSEDFSRRGQSISSLVYNIIGVRNAQAAQDHSESMGRITWITFIFFPLITVSGLFGMNINLLANNPSVKWYFIVAVPLLVLVLSVAFVMQNLTVIKARMHLHKPPGGSREP